MRLRRTIDAGAAVIVEASVLKDFFAQLTPERSLRNSTCRIGACQLAQQSMQSWPISWPNAFSNGAAPLIEIAVRRWLSMQS